MHEGLGRFIPHTYEIVGDLEVEYVSGAKDTIIVAETKRGGSKYTIVRDAVQQLRVSAIVGAPRAVPKFHELPPSVQTAAQFAFERIDNYLGGLHKDAEAHARTAPQED